MGKVTWITPAIAIAVVIVPRKMAISSFLSNEFERSEIGISTDRITSWDEIVQRAYAKRAMRDEIIHRDPNTQSKRGIFFFPRSYIHTYLNSMIWITPENGTRASSSNGDWYLLHDGSDFMRLLWTSIYIGVNSIILDTAYIFL